MELRFVYITCTDRDEAGRIAEALVATAFGLAVAIPASVAYNSFLGVLNSIETELVNYAGEFLNRAQRELPWLSSGARVQPEEQGSI